MIELEDLSVLSNLNDSKICRQLISNPNHSFNTYIKEEIKCHQQPKETQLSQPQHSQMAERLEVTAIVHSIPGNPNLWSFFFGTEGLLCEHSMHLPIWVKVAPNTLVRIPGLLTPLATCF